MDEAIKAKHVLTLRFGTAKKKKGTAITVEVEHGPAEGKLVGPTKAEYEAAIAAFNSVKLEKAAENTGREH